MEILNSECFCISVDTSALRQALESEIGEPGLFDLIQQRCPHLFASRPVFLSHDGSPTSTSPDRFRLEPV